MSARLDSWRTLSLEDFYGIFLVYSCGEDQLSDLSACIDTLTCNVLGFHSISTRLSHKSCTMGYTLMPVTVVVFLNILYLNNNSEELIHWDHRAGKGTHSNKEVADKFNGQHPQGNPISHDWLLTSRRLINPLCCFTYLRAELSWCILVV